MYVYEQAPILKYKKTAIYFLNTVLTINNKLVVKNII